MADLGQAYVQIVPSAEGITEKISGVIEPAVNKAGATGGKALAQSLGKGFSNVGKGLTAFVTVPLAAIGTASMAAFNEVDAGMDTIVEKTGASGAALDDMQKALEGIATSIPTEFGTAGEAIGEVNTRFGLTGEKLEKLSGQFVKFAKLNDTDVSNSIDSVQKSISAFGLDADYAGNLLDRLNSVGQATGVSVDTLTSGLVQNGTAFQEMGLSIDQAVVFMGQLEKSGANSETVMQGLRKALKNATADGTSMGDALSKLQDEILNGTDSMDGLSAAYELFGRSGDQIYAAVKNGTIDFKNFGNVLEDVSGNVSTTFEGTLDPADRFKLVLNELKIIGADIASVLGEFLVPVLDKVKGVLDKVKARWDSLSPAAQEMIVKIGLIAAAIGPVLLAIGKMISIVSTLTTTIKTISNAVSLFSAGPMGLIVVAIAAAVTAGVLLYQNWDTICEWAEKLKEKIVNAWDTIKTKVTDAISNIKKTVTEAWDTIKNKVSSTIDSIKTTVTGKFENIKGTVTGVWESLKQNTSNAWGNMKSAVEQNGGGIRGVLATAVQGFQTIWGSGLSALDRLTGGVLGNVAKWFTGTFQNIWGYISGIAQRIAGIFNFQWSLPHISLPHFSWSWNDLGVVKIPSISVQWYKTGGIFDDPSLIGVGEAGREAVVPLQGSYMRPFARAIAEEMGGIRNAGDASGANVITINVYPSPGMDERALADMVQQRLALVQRQRQSAWGTV